MKSQRTRTTCAMLFGLGLLCSPATNARAYAPLGGTMFELGDEPCLKGRGNCAIYPKSAQLPSGRLVAAFEKSTVAASGGAAGQTLPIYTSTNYGSSWEPLSAVPAPAYLTSDPAYAKFTSHWTNPYLYVLPQTVGNLQAGTLLLASIVSGEDEYYRDQKASEPSWVPSNDGDRRDLAIALFASHDEGSSWEFVNTVATGGWQGGSAGAIGQHIANANTFAQVDPLWEPHLMVYNNQLVCFYSDENDYLAVDPSTGEALLNPNNDTAPDSHGQVLVHKTWDGTAANWSGPIVDVAGTTVTLSDGTTQIGGGRPGMSTVVPTEDGLWLLTFEYWGGGANTRYKLASDPLAFGADNDVEGQPVSQLPTTAGSGQLAQGGSPVLVKLGDGRLAYNASDSGNIWVNASGRSDGAWTEFQTTLGSGYSRNLQYVQGTGRVVILQGTWGGASDDALIRYGEVDLGYSSGPYFQLINRATGLVIGTGGNTTDANIGNQDVPDVVTEARGSVVNLATQAWHVTVKANGAVTLLNQAGGRAAAIWTGNATTGQLIGQWTDDLADGSWVLVETDSGYARLQSALNPNLYLTAPQSPGQLQLQTTTSDGTQEWLLWPQAAAVPAPSLTTCN